VIKTNSLAEVGRVFLRLGTTSFGGPAAHIAMMEEEIVARRQWLTREQFLDYVGATNLIPGPNSTELAIHIGHARAGWPGLIVAGAAFIFPAAAMVLCLAWAYVRFGALPSVVQAFAGVKPVVIAIVAQALWRLARTAVRSPSLALIGAFAIAATVMGVHELLVLAGGGLAAALLSAKRSNRAEPLRSVVVGLPLSQSAQSVAIVGAGGAIAADCGHYSRCFSKLDRCCSAADTCSWRSCAQISSNVCTGSRNNSCSMRSQSDRSRRDRCLRPRRSSDISSPAGRARLSRPSESFFQPFSSSR
jgi:chromate transporter